MKKVTISFLLTLIIFGCGPNEPKIMETNSKTLFNSLEIQMPVGFVQEDSHNWLYNRDKTVGRIYLSQMTNSDDDLESILSDFRETMFEEPLSKFELINEDSINEPNKQGLIKQYRLNENDGGTYPVYTHHTVGVLKLDGNVIKIRTLSLGFNLNPTIDNIFFKISNTSQSSLILNQDKIQTASIFEVPNSIFSQEWKTYEAHNIAVPNKFKFEGQSNSETLQLKYEDRNNGVIYYLTSSQLPDNLDLGYYFESYTENLEKDGFSVENTTFKNKTALQSELTINNNFMYRLHFVNQGKGQSLMMLTNRESKSEFQKYINSVKLLD